MINLTIFISFGQSLLTIEISGLRNNEGQIILELSDEKEISIKSVTKKITGSKCTIVIENLKPGKYGFKYFHDQNNNSKLDINWIGIPKEGYGFSNNAKGRFGPPDFNDTLFEVKESTFVKCNPTYLFK